MPMNLFQFFHRIVALLAEGVDRNSVVYHLTRQLCVALLAEGVDRNWPESVTWKWKVPSPSSRRAWIEIRAANGTSISKRVALLAEGVDRNSFFDQLQRQILGRPPRGGRG